MRRAGQLLLVALAVSCGGRSNRAKEKDREERKKACRGGLKDLSWRPSKSVPGKLYYHRQECYEDANATMKTIVPRKCRRVGLTDAVKCLRRDNISQVVFVGDSVSSQLWGTALCTAPGKLLTQETYFRLFSISKVEVKPGFWWTTLRVRGTPRAERIAAALKTAFSSGLLLEPSMWVVNAGLWHLTCNRSHTFDCLDSESKYSESVAELLSTLDTSARGRLLWRPTTAVNRDNLPRRKARRDQKFRFFNNNNVIRLNAVAATLIQNDFPRFQYSTSAYDATIRSPLDALPGDIRHYRSTALHSLLQLDYLHWCNEVFETAIVEEEPPEEEDEQDKEPEIKEEDDTPTQN